MLIFVRQLPPSLLSDNQSILAEAGLERGIILYTKLCHYAGNISYRLLIVIVIMFVSIELIVMVTKNYATL